MGRWSYNRWGLTFPLNYSEVCHYFSFCSQNYCHWSSDGSFRNWFYFIFYVTVIHMFLASMSTSFIVSCGGGICKYIQWYIMEERELEKHMASNKQICLGECDKRSAFHYWLEWVVAFLASVAHVWVLLMACTCTVPRGEQMAGQIQQCQDSVWD